MKMYCIFARESIDKMGGNRGKLAAMAGHAYLGAYLNSAIANPAAQNEYRMSNEAAKICCVMDSVDDLKMLQKVYQGKVGTALIEDAGRTVFAEPTIVCLGVGPLPDEYDKINQLKVLL